MKRIDDESDDEGEEQGKDAIANELFEGLLQIKNSEKTKITVFFP